MRYSKEAHSRRPLFSVCVAIFLWAPSVFAHYHIAYFHSPSDFPTPAYNQKWMESLDGSRTLDTLSIPGTHDTGMHVGLQSYFEEQSAI